MNLTARQSQILNWIIENYIELAKPISSSFLERKYKPDFSSATIRLEYKNLTQKGYLEKVHISSGRIPTNKAYEFFVSEILSKIKKRQNFPEFSVTEILVENNLFKAFREFSKKLALLSKSLIFVYFKSLDILLKEGWEDVFSQPEFNEKKTVFDFLKFAKGLEKSLRMLCSKNDFQIYIGKKTPFSKTDDFSLLIKKAFIKSDIKKNRIEPVYFCLSGPKRMNYEKNIKILFSLKDYLQTNYGKR